MLISQPIRRPSAPVAINAAACSRVTILPVITFDFGEGVLDVFDYGKLESAVGYCPRRRYLDPHPEASEGGPRLRLRCWLLQGRAAA
jgi:hypothetical protein